MRASERSARIGLFFLAAGLFTASCAAAYTVTSLADSGPGTLRDAILTANAAGVPASIDFNITNCGNVCVIRPASTLPAITVPLTIDGYTQPGSLPNGLPVGSNAVIRIALDVNGVSGNGFTFSSSATSSILRGLSIEYYGDGVAGTAVVVMADGVAVEGNFIGIDASGALAASNAGAIGVEVNGPSNVRIGGPAPAQRNVIGDNTVAAIRVPAGASGTLIQGNYLGMNAVANAPISNQYGILVQSTGPAIGAVTIGGTAAGSGNLIAGNTSNGIRVVAPNVPSVTTVAAVTIQGNRIGLDTAGNNFGNGGDGIYLLTAPGSTLGPVLIGGTAAGARNVIVGVPNAIHAFGTANVTIQGNFIATNPAGLASQAGGGIYLEGGGSFSGSAQIGGAAGGAGNVIGGLGALAGVTVGLTTAVIEGNSIGVGSDGVTPLGPNNSPGILVDSSDAVIGGTTAAQRNMIANRSIGVVVRITQPGIRNAAKATILGNSIFSNQNGGIDLNDDAETPNDPGDGDAGPNGLQNYPVLAAPLISGGSVVVSGTLNSVPNQVYRIEFFANSACGIPGRRQGRIFLGWANFSTDGSGNLSFTSAPMPIPPGYHGFTATATDPSGNTSEFSACVGAAGPNSSFHTLTPCRIVDTRNASGPYGGPSLPAGGDRTFVIAGQCGVPVGATAVALNLAVTQASASGDLRVVPAGDPLPDYVSSINWTAGRTRANSAIIALGPNGDILVHVDQQGGTVDLIIDTSGYFQ